MSLNSGKFINFSLDYAQMDNQAQAKAILDKADALISGGENGVSITYSANYSQTVEIEKTYMSGEWDTRTSGANQATVMRIMLQMLATDPYKHLQGKMRISPITTMAGGTAYAQKISKDVNFHLGIVASDLVRIKNSLESGWTVLGWQNQKTVNNPKHPYAVGGGVKANMPQAIDSLIQDTLIQYNTDFN